MAAPVCLARFRYRSLRLTSSDQNAARLVAFDLAQPWPEERRDGLRVLERSGAEGEDGAVPPAARLTRPVHVPQATDGLLKTVEHPTVGLRDLDE